LAVDGWAVTFGTARRGLGGLLAVPNVTAHPSTVNVPITVLLYNGPLLCGFNVHIKGLRYANRNNLNVFAFYLWPDEVIEGVGICFLDHTIRQSVPLNDAVLTSLDSTDAQNGHWI